MCISTIRDLYGKTLLILAAVAQLFKSTRGATVSTASGKADQGYSSLLTPNRKRLNSQSPSPDLHQTFASDMPRWLAEDVGPMGRAHDLLPKASKRSPACNVQLRTEASQPCHNYRSKKINERGLEQVTLLKVFRAFSCFVAWSTRGDKVKQCERPFLHHPSCP